ncbi:flavodoxin domain-containing protein [Colwellia sp. 1_MG-2023]|uniref:flavodoxin domain-containing protein n=1 Tax=Colwellia sp. 1_MG-2023 TaxID=3062649 RepID=UPI0026E3C6E0|nr:flavodoxin domain-containing protein [Colwellia sp. 1_MG-2023]MDO6446697.1 flavodoxin domain-containing protein [Colwellia sp. 1_MG-2023]
MASLQIIVGSMLGGSEYVAEACEEILSSLNHQAEVHLSPDFSQIPIENQTWLICTSTHGAGEYPDNIQAFVNNLSESTDDLSKLRFFTIGLGDTSYDTFCYAAKNINNLLKSKGSIEIIPLKTFDMLEDIDPEEEAKQWIIENNDRI